MSIKKNRYTMRGGIHDMNVSAMIYAGSHCGSSIFVNLYPISPITFVLIDIVAVIEMKGGI